MNQVEASIDAEAALVRARLSGDLKACLPGIPSTIDIPTEANTAWRLTRELNDISNFSSLTQSSRHRAISSSRGFNF